MEGDRIERVAGALENFCVNMGWIVALHAKDGRPHLVRASLGAEPPSHHSQPYNVKHLIGGQNMLEYEYQSLAAKLALEFLKRCPTIRLTETST
jgi:hypothetical protein